MGSYRKWFCHSAYATGASAIGVPGCPLLAAWTASIDSVRMVLMASCSMLVDERDSVTDMAIVVMGVGLT
jgi:hypothetical protein